MAVPAPAMSGDPLQFQDEELSTIEGLEATFDHSEFYPKENVMVLSGQVNIIYRDVSITADRIALDMNEERAEASGNVILWQAGEQLFTDYLLYDFRDNNFTFRAAAYDGHWVYVKAPQVEVEEAGKYLLARNARVTTCDLVEPHYHFKANRVVLHAGKRVSVHHAWLKIGDIPVGYFPYLTRSLDTHDPIYIFSGGYSRRKGVMVQNTVETTFHEYLRLRLYGDYYSEIGPAVGARNRYEGKDPEKMQGFIYGYYLFGDDDNDFIEGPPSRAREVEAERWKISGDHWQQLTDRSILSARYQALSDHEYNDDFREQELLKGIPRDQLDYQRNSFVNLAHRGENYNYRITAKSRLNDFFFNEFYEDERLPQVRVDGIRRELFDSPLYFKTGVEFTRFNIEREVFSEPNSLRFSQEASRGEFDFEPAVQAGAHRRSRLAFDFNPGLPDGLSGGRVQNRSHNGSFGGLLRPQTCQRERKQPREPQVA